MPNVNTCIVQDCNQPIVNRYPQLCEEHEAEFNLDQLRNEYEGLPRRIKDAADKLFEIKQRKATHV